MMRTRSYFALILLCLLGGCQKPRPATKPSPLKVEMRRFERLLPGCGDERQAQPCFSFHVAYPEVTGAATPEIASRLNAQIRALLQPAGAPPGFEEESVQLIEQYQNRPRQGSRNEEPAWFVRRIAEVVYSTGAVLSIRMDKTEYLGGPEASTVFDCLNLNPDTGAALQLQDLLVQGGEDAVRTIAEKRFRDERKIPADTPLSQMGYAFLGERFVLPPRFLVEKRGLQFVFNASEVSKVGISPTQLIIPWKDVMKFIRRDIALVPPPAEQAGALKR